MKKITRLIYDVHPEQKSAYALIERCRNPVELYEEAHRDAKMKCLGIAKDFENYIEQLEGFALSVMPESMLLELRKECGIE